MGCLSCITEPPRRPNLASDVFGFHRKPIAYARIKYCYIDGDKVGTQKRHWTNAKGDLVGGGFMIHDWKSNLQNILGYIPFIGISSGISRFHIAANVEYYNGNYVIESESYKTAQVIRGIIECSGFGSVFLVADFLIWIGREINWFRFDGMYYIYHDGKTYDTNDPAIQEVKSQILKLGVPSW